MAKSGRLELREIFTDNIGPYSTTESYLASKEIEIGEKTQNKGCYAVKGHSRSCKVIEVGTNRKPVCDFLLVINSNYHPISYRFGDIAAYCSNFVYRCVFEPPIGGLETTYDVHLGLIGKRVVDFLLVIIEHFSLGVTAEALRAKIDRKSAISLQRGHFNPKIQIEGDVHHQ